MKKFFANTDSGNLYEDPHITEVEYEHFADNSESTVVGYDGDVLPVGLTRRISAFLYSGDILYTTRTKMQQIT